MDLLASNDFFEASKTDEFAVLEIKERVFDLITDVELSSKLLDFLYGIDHDKDVKALVFLNSPNSLSDDNYDRFIHRILDSERSKGSNSVPHFTEKNIRFREINILNKLIRAIASLKSLVIAGIQGTVVTPFIGAALVADFRYASEHAVLSMIHNKYGLHPSGGLPFFLSSFLHHSKAMEVQMSQTLDAKKALELGLFTRLLPDENFRENLLDEVRQFTRLDFRTIRDTKRLTNFSRKDLERYFEFEATVLNL